MSLISLAFLGEWSEKNIFGDDVTVYFNEKHVIVSAQRFESESLKLLREKGFKRHALNGKPFRALDREWWAFGEAPPFWADAVDEGED